MAFSCLICQKESEFRFCGEHAPKYGDNIKVNGSSIYVGSIPLSMVVFDLSKKLKIVKWWMGTDVLTLIKYVPGKSKVGIWLHRIKMRLLNEVIDEHWFVSEKLREEIPQKYVYGNSDIVYLNSQHRKYPKKEKIIHALVYRPPESEFNRWVYGLDIIDQLKKEFPKIVWIEADGTLEMEHIYPIVDFYIRPTRHDGAPKMVWECDINDIPVYWSKDGKPDIEEIRRFIYWVECSK